MAEFQITGPDGNTYRITAPDDATNEQVLAFVQANAGKPQETPKPDAFAGENRGAVPFIDKAYQFVRGLGSARDQGMSLGFADEAKAGIDAAMGGDYDKSLAHERGIGKEFQDEHPILSTGANIVGGMGLLGPGSGLVGRAAALPGMRSLARQPGWLKVTEAGAATGAATGFGEGEGGIGPRVENAALGGAMGGALGFALPAATKAIGAAVSPVLDSWRDPGKVASRKVLQALERDGLNPADLTARLDDMGPNAALVDAGGENLSSLGRAAAGVPGKAKARAAEFLDERQAGQVPRVVGATKEAMGDVGDYYNTLDDLMAQRARDAAPLYEKAYAAPVTWEADFGGLMSRPSMKSALSRAHKIAAEEGRDPTALGFTLNDAGDVSFASAPSMQTLDYVKRGLDDVLEGFRDKTTGRLVLDESGRAINNTRINFLKALDDANPDYKAARQAWAGPTQSADAVAMGRDFLKADAEITAKQLDRLSDSDKTFYRAGAYRAIKDQIEATPDAADAVKRIFGSEGKRAKLRAVFPSDEAFGKFEKAMSAEADMFATRFKVLGGSQTAQRAAEMSDLPGGDIAGVAMDVATGNTPSLIRRGANWVVDRARVPTERLADPLSSMLFTPGQGNSAIVQQLLAAPPPPKPFKPGPRAALISALIGQQSGAAVGP